MEAEGQEAESAPTGPLAFPCRQVPVPVQKPHCLLARQAVQLPLLLPTGGGDSDWQKPGQAARASGSPLLSSAVRYPAAAGHALESDTHVLLPRHQLHQWPLSPAHALQDVRLEQADCCRRSHCPSSLLPGKTPHFHATAGAVHLRG